MGRRSADQGRWFRVTPYLVGLALAGSSIYHFWLSAHAAWWGSSSFSVHLSPTGIVMYGFFGWPIWHGGAAIAALLLFSGWRTGQGWAALALSLLWILALPLLLITVFGQNGFGAPLILMGMLLPPVVAAYMSWWLAQELRTEPGTGGRGS